MRSTMLLLFLTIAILISSSTNAQAEIITDEYWGANPTQNWSDRDVIGHDYYFQISKMEVTFNPAGMQVDVYTRYLDNIGVYATALGDLFVSTDGWNPKGAPPYSGDNFHLGGEDWEYALVMDNHTPSTELGQLSGMVSLYLVDEAKIILSSAPTGYVYREGQEVQYNGAGEPLAAGTWSIENLGGADDDDFLRFIIDYDFGDVSNYGYHWTITCGNDVMEGEDPVPAPEPATLVLLGTGLLGLAGVRRKLGS